MISSWLMGSIGSTSTAIGGARWEFARFAARDLRPGGHTTLSLFLTNRNGPIYRDGDARSSSARWLPVGVTDHKTARPATCLQSSAAGGVFLRRLPFGLIKKLALE